VKAMKKYAILALALLAGTAFANGIADPYMEAKYQSMGCYAYFATELLWDAQGYYPDPPPAPAYLEELIDDIGYKSETGALPQLYDYAVEGNRAAFDSQVRTLQGLVNDAKALYRGEARNAIMNGWESRGNVRDDYSNARSNLQCCLGGGDS